MPLPLLGWFAVAVSVSAQAHQLVGLAPIPGVGARHVGALGPTHSVPHSNPHDFRDHTLGRATLGSRGSQLLCGRIRGIPAT